MRVGIGICGIGLGHSSRQLEVARTLMASGIAVEIYGYGRSHDFFSAAGLETHRVWTPILPGTPRGLDIPKAVAINYQMAILGMYRNLCLRRYLAERGPPDLFITDYEPVTARLAYHFKKPLITIDQQSKYVYFPFPEIAGRRATEYTWRHKLFFPTAARRLVVSFFKLPNHADPGIRVVPPILPPQLVPFAASENIILVYFSSFLNTTVCQGFPEFVTLFRGHPDFSFRIYTDALPPPNLPENVSFHVYERQRFLRDLSAARGVISTAGHTLMSEAFACGKPFLAIPIASYDQYYCAHLVTSLGLGMSATTLTASMLAAFLDELDRYRDNIASSERLNYANTGVSAVMIHLMPFL